VESRGPVRDVAQWNQNRGCLVKGVRRRRNEHVERYDGRKRYPYEQPTQELKREHHQMLLGKGYDP
jgi:hypothetical protein